MNNILKMIGYLVINLREGDMVSMIGLHTNRNAANQQLINLMMQHDNSTTWWKIVEIEHQNINPGLYDAVLRVSWGSSNRVKFIGLFQPGTVPPQHYEGERYFVERVECV